MSRQPLRLAIIEAASVLEEAGVPSPRVDAELLAAHLLGIERGRLGLVPLVEATTIDAYRSMVEQRAKRIPLQYITGTSPMGEIDLAVGPGVFVPRPETELLLGWALAFLERHGSRNPVVLDLCTGSGALALAIAHARPDAEVHAVELEAKALAWARRNAETRAEEGDSPIRLYQGDVTDRMLLTNLEGSVDLVVANPPYIPEGADLEPEVVEHDPHSALFGERTDCPSSGPWFPTLRGGCGSGERQRLSTTTRTACWSPNCSSSVGCSATSCGTPTSPGRPAS